MDQDIIQADNEKRLPIKCRRWKKMAISAEARGVDINFQVTRVGYAFRLRRFGQESCNLVAQMIT